MHVFNDKITERVFILILFHMGILFGLPGALFAQQKQEISGDKAVIDEIRKLRGGVLVVRLESDQKKLEALENMVNSRGLTEKRHKKLKQQLEDAKTKANTRTKDYLRAFKQFYDFSDVVFMYDFQTTEFKKKELDFFDAEENIVSGKDIFHRPHLILSKGSSEYNASEILEFLTDDLRRIGKPAPRSHFGVFSFFTSTDVRIMRINKKLHILLGT